MQTTNSSLEWSDGTMYDLRVSMSDLEEDGSSKKQETRCVFVTPAGDWMRSSCHAVAQGAVCYTSTVNTLSQSKLPVTAPHFRKEDNLLIPLQRVKVGQRSLTTTQLFVCVRHFNQGARLQAAPEANQCRQDGGRSMWVQHQDHCYLFNTSFYNYSVYNMATAKSICQRMGGSQLFTSIVDISFCLKWLQTSRLLHFSGAEMLTLKSTEENEFVSKYIKDDPFATNRVWLGLEFSVEGNFK